LLQYLLVAGFAGPRALPIQTNAHRCLCHPAKRLL
jgi:hypothetical protein